MARHARNRSTARPGSNPCRDRKAARRGRCAPAQRVPVPTLIGVVTCAADFEALRSDGGTEYQAYADYLRDLELLLGALRGKGGQVRGRCFHPADLADYCERHGLPAADPDSHAAYIADPDGEAEWVDHEGEPLPDFLEQLTRARERGLARRALDRLLAETAEAAATGAFPEEPLREAYQQGAAELRQMLAGARPGRYLLVGELHPGEQRIEVCTELRLDPGQVLRIDDADLELLCTLLCTGLALDLPGSVLLAGRSGAAGGATGRPVAWGWQSEGGGYRRGNAADVLQGLSAPVAVRVALAGAGTSAAGVVTGDGVLAERLPADGRGGGTPALRRPAPGGSAAARR
ncbi:hypothetical protein [Streptacidiphilus albus]|uniref:hypothetical protein n=1 Tax=Streptacidiphilus albus TaxID=105425 RepID=UPI00054BCE80|nr:hypothetical protein [Streptacidiphilus albus]